MRSLSATFGALAFPAFAIAACGDSGGSGGGDAGDGGEPAAGAPSRGGSASDRGGSSSVGGGGRNSGGVAGKGGSSNAGTSGTNDAGSAGGGIDGQGGAPAEGGSSAGGAPAEGGSSAGGAPAEGGSNTDAGTTANPGGAGDGGSGGQTADACAGVVCDAPPADACADGVLSSYASEGVCAEGDCTYEQIDVACTHGCSSGACACTPDDPEPVDTGTATPADTSIGVDSEGGLHIAYWMDAALYYAYRAAGGTWASDLVDPDAPAAVGWYPSLFIDADDGVHIAYGVVTTGGIRYAYRAAEAPTFDFDVVPADPDAGTGLDISLAVDGLGGVHIAHRWDGDLMYTYKPADGDFTTYPLSPPGTANNSGSSLAIGPDGTVYIAFVNMQDNVAQLATKTGEPADFDYSEIDASEVIPTLHADRNGGLHVALFHPPLTYAMEYGYRAPGSTTFALTPVDFTNSVGLYIDIETDRFGGVHIAYDDQDDRDLRYAYKPPGGAFSTDAVAGTAEDERAGEYASLAVDDAGVAHVSYAHFDDESLVYLAICPAE